MAWKVKTKMSQRYEFVQLAKKEGCNFSQLCKRFNISRPTGYKWLKRYKENDISTLHDQSRRPYSSINKTKQQIEKLILNLRQQHQSWADSFVLSVQQSALPGCQSTMRRCGSADYSIN